MRSLLCVLLAACVAAAPAPACDATQPKYCKSSKVVPTEAGPVQGFVRSIGLAKPVEYFWGIPYADPPVGNLRFVRPQPYSTPWTDVRPANSLGSMCAQLTITEKGSFYFGSEDCLFLNVYKPESANATSNLPVYVFIHGGGYVFGDGYQEGIYDGANMAATKNMVVVTLNYRMNAMGFFALDALCNADESGSCGNYGLQDQRMALEWVSRNIKSFGGNPSQVTVAGESAGAFSVVWHLVSPRSAGLFSRAVVESGTSDVSWFFQRKADAVEFYTDYAEYIGCGTNVTDQIACLRGLDASKFILPLAPMLENLILHEIANKSLPPNVPFASPVYPFMPFGPVIDGSPDGLLGLPADLAEKGEFNKVPLLIGSNKNDGSIFEPSAAAIVPGFTFPATDAGFSIALEWFVGEEANVSIATNLYSDYEFRSVQTLRNDERLAHIIRDLVFMCTNRRLATAWAKHNVDVYVYTFAYDLGDLDNKLRLGDFHTSELPFVFQNYIPEISVFARDAKEIAEAVSGWWSNFAHTSNPNADPNVPEWPKFVLDAANPDDNRQGFSLRAQPMAFRLQLDNVFPDDDFPSDNKCNFWDQQTLPWHTLEKEPALLKDLPFYKASARRRQQQQVETVEL